MPEGEKNASIWQRLFALAPLIFAVNLLSIAIVDLNLIRGPQADVLDAWLRLRRMSSHSDRVAIVTINDSEFQTLFGGKSPLDPVVLRELIEAIAASGASVIGVDIRTAHPQFRSLFVNAGDSVIVWGRLARADRGSAARLYQLEDFVGGRNDGLSGIAGALTDSDGTIRTYLREYPVKTGATRGLAYQIALECQRTSCAPEHLNLLTSKEDWAGRPRMIDFTGNATSSESDPAHSAGETNVGASAFDTFGAGAVLRASRSPAWRRAELFKNKIVLLGGSYFEAGDEHETPLGTMSGAELTAQIVETELRDGGGSLIPTSTAMVAANTAVGIGLVIAYEEFGELLAVLVNIAVALLIPPLLSVVFFWSSAFWPSFMAMPVAFLVSRMGDYQESAVKRLYREVRKAATQLWR
jgi:CHASE2 domain-containing sensor protein